MTTITAVSAAPGDLIVYSTTDLLSADAAHRIGKTLMDEYPGRHFVILDKGGTLDHLDDTRLRDLGLQRIPAGA